MKPARVRKHPLYGEIPLMHVKHTAPSGRDDSYWRYDLDWAPPLPTGAVRGNPNRQVFCQMCHVPKYFYVDEEKTCVACGERFVFGAREQKFWYEDRQFNFHSAAIRCVDCRRARRSQVALDRQLAEAVGQARPDDPLSLLALVEATLAAGKGDLARALAAARRAGRVALEGLYWEARVQEAAGRPKQAVERYTDFLQRTTNGARYKNLRRDAQKRLDKSIR